MLLRSFVFSCLSFRLSFTDLDLVRDRLCLFGTISVQLFGKPEWTPNSQLSMTCGRFPIFKEQLFLHTVPSYPPTVLKTGTAMQHSRTYSYDSQNDYESYMAQQQPQQSGSLQGYVGYDRQSSRQHYLPSPQPSNGAVMTESSFKLLTLL